jgi:hypothetical protein
MSPRLPNQRLNQLIRGPIRIDDPLGENSGGAGSVRGAEPSWPGRVVRPPVVGPGRQPRRLPAVLRSLPPLPRLVRRSSAGGDTDSREEVITPRTDHRTAVSISTGPGREIFPGVGRFGRLVSAHPLGCSARLEVTRIRPCNYCPEGREQMNPFRGGTNQVRKDKGQGVRHGDWPVPALSTPLTTACSDLFLRTQEGLSLFCSRPREGPSV